MSAAPADPIDQVPPASGGRVVPIRRGRESQLTDDELLARLRGGETALAAHLFDRYGAYVRRVIARVVGADPDLHDMVHDAFVSILRDVGKVERADALQAWLRSVAVFTARGHLRARGRRKWLRFLAPADLPDRASRCTPEGTSEAAKRAWAAIERLPVDERIVFTLRFLEELELREIADACGTSLSTVKRRLQRARERFDEMAAADPALADWRAAGAADEPSEEP